MAKTIKIEFTEAQFDAVVDMVDTISAMIGTGEEFAIEQNKNIRLFDRAMKKNGYKRTHV